MLSKVFNTAFCGLFNSQPIVFTNAFAFCSSTTQRYESHPLRNKIMGLSSFDEFNNFFKDRKQQFDSSCYSIASRTLAKILIESKLVLTYQNREALKTYLSNLQKIDIDALNLQQFSQLLYLLRIIKLDPNNNTNFAGQYIRSILERSENKLKELEADTSLSRLCYFYQEYSSLGPQQATVLSRRINNILYSNNTEVEFQHLTINEINLILKGMKSKRQLSRDDLLLLRNIIKTIFENYFDKLSFFELAQISVAINEIHSNNVGDTISNTNVDQIHKKVLSNIDQMDEKSVMYILNGKKTNNKTYFQIYRIIFQKILDEIQPNGESSFNELFTLRLFNGISDKVKLRMTTPENQDKFFAFFRQTVTKTPRFVHSFLENYIQKGFLNYKHLLIIQEILESLPDFHFRLSLLYELSNRNINVEKLISLDKFKELELRDRNLIMMISILESLTEREGANKQKYIELVDQMKQKFFQMYKVEDETILRLILNLDSGIIRTLYRIFRKQFDTKLPNPFETEQSDKYRVAWLKLQIHGCVDVYFIKRYANQIKDKLTAKDLQNVLRSVSFDTDSSKDALSNALILVGKRLDLVFSHQQLLSSVSRTLFNQTANIFEDSSSEILKSRFWYIINQSLEKLEPKKFFDTFGLVFNQMLKGTIYQFKFSSQYQTFLTKVLQKSQFIRNRHVSGDLFDQCLKLNLIKRQTIPSISQNIKDNLSENHKLLLKMIQNNEFALEGVQLTKNNLHLFLFNLSPETFTFLAKNQDKIISLIEQMKVREVWKCITHYRLGSKKQQVLIFDALFKQMNKYTLFFEDFSPVFIGEVLRRNNFEKYFVRIENVKSFFKNAMEYFTQRRNTHKLPLEDHIELIKAANDLKIRNDEYVHTLFEKYSGDNNTWKRQLYLTAGNIGLELSKKEIQRLIDHNLFTGFTSSFAKCFNIFLFNEKELENPGSHLTNLINKYNELKFKEKVPIYALHYEYLKKVYPEETKNWEPNHVEKADFCRSLEALNHKSHNSLRETMEQITNQKWVEHVLCGNYYYTFRNAIFLLPLQSKYHGENILLKKIFSTLTGNDKIILLNRRQTNTRSAVKFIQTSQPGLITVEEQEKIMKKLDHKFEQQKESVQSEQHEEPVEEQKTN